MARIILKIQKPISTNDPNSPWLLYSKDRKRQFTMADKLLPQNVRANIEKHGGKAYWYCTMVLNTICFLCTAPSQDW
jgi:hypothetical protein